MKIYTIGTSKKSARVFFELLRKHKIQKVIDIRLKNKSQLSGYAKGNDLEFFLKEWLQIGYEHIPDLAPTKELLQNYQDKKKTKTYRRWDIYEEEFKKLLTSRDVLSIFKETSTGYDRVALLCSEPKADKCHRRLVAENPISRSWQRARVSGQTVAVYHRRGL